MICLGINYSQMKDSSACLIRDGRVVHAVAEERLSRVKHDGSFPLRAIESCLTAASVRPTDIDFVCFGWSPVRKAFLHDLSDFVSGKCPVDFVNVASTVRYFVSMTRQDGGAKLFEDHFGPTVARKRFVDHHLAHAISAYAYSGFDDAAVWCSMAAARGKRLRFGTGATANSNTFGRFRGRIRLDFFTRSSRITLASSRTAMNGK